MTILSPRSTLGTTAFILPSDLNDDWTYMAGSGHYKTADLLDALGAVPTADMAKEIAEAQRGADEWKARAEAATEALAASQERCSEHMQIADERAEVARTKAAALAAERDRLLATIERIDAVRRDFYEVRGDWADPEGAAALKAQMERAILGDPPFELPTEAGAIGIATFNCVGTEYTKPIRLCRNGTWCSVDEKQYFQPEDIIDFKPAKIVEAEQ